MIVTVIHKTLVWFMAALAGTSQQVLPPVSPDQIHAALAEGREDDAWTLIERLPADALSLAIAVNAATRTPVVDVPETRRIILTRLTARVTLAEGRSDLTHAACAILLKVSRDTACETAIDAALRQGQVHPLEQARLWTTLVRLGFAPAPLPDGWETGVTGNSAIEAAGWTELPAGSRVRLLEPLVTHQDMGLQASALATLQTIPGQEALALWRRIAANPPSYPGARTQVTVGLARHGDEESLKVLAPHEHQLSTGDRLVLNLGRAERGSAPARRVLVDLLARGSELEALLAAETLANLKPTTAEATLLRRVVVGASPVLRSRIMGVAARFGLGRTPEVVRQLGDADPQARLDAGVAVAASISSAARTR